MSCANLKTEIINEILKDEFVSVKSQQVGEPEMTLTEKRIFLEEFIEEKKASVFLSRFGRYLRPAQMEFFKSRHNDDPDEQYCIDYHLEQLQRNAAPKASIIRNRRFGALQKLLDDKDGYFSEQEMMQREPAVYEQLVGQHMNEQEKQMRDRCEHPTFLGALLKGIEMEHLREDTEKAKKEEAPLTMEDDSDGEDEEEKVVRGCSLWGEFDGAAGKPVEKKRAPQTKVSDAERDELKHEFIEIMYQKFLSGQDTGFDYSTVDNNPEYDDLEMEDQDKQDKYFDESD